MLVVHILDLTHWYSLNMGGCHNRHLCNTKCKRSWQGRVGLLGESLRVSCNWISHAFSIISTCLRYSQISTPYSKLYFFFGLHSFSSCRAFSSPPQMTDPFSQCHGRVLPHNGTSFSPKAWRIHHYLASNVTGCKQSCPCSVLFGKAVLVLYLRVSKFKYFVLLSLTPKHLQVCSPFMLKGRATSPLQIYM